MEEDRRLNELLFQWEEDLLRCIIFDFNGVIINDEQQHFRAFARVLDEQGLTLTEEEYFSSYLGLDDKGCLAAVLNIMRQRPASVEEIDALVERKADVYLEELRSGMELFPGVVDLVKRLDGELSLAINSGARRHEIEHVIAEAGLGEFFKVIVSADEVSEGKPSPEGYLEALERIRRLQGGCKDLVSEQCLVIEDAPNGITAALRAGMACVGVTNSCERGDLGDAHLVVDTLEGLSVDDLRAASAAFRKEQASGAR